MFLSFLENFGQDVSFVSASIVFFCLPVVQVMDDGIN